MVQDTQEKACRQVPAPEPAVRGRSPSFLGQSIALLAQEIEGALCLQMLSFSGFCSSSVLRILRPNSMLTNCVLFPPAPSP